MLAQPEQPPLFDGVIGVAFLIGLPVLIRGSLEIRAPGRDKGRGGCLRDDVPVLAVFEPADTLSLADIARAGGRNLRRGASVSRARKRRWPRSCNFRLAASALAALVTGGSVVFAKGPAAQWFSAANRGMRISRGTSIITRITRRLNTETPAESQGVADQHEARYI